MTKDEIIEIARREFLYKGIQIDYTSLSLYMCNKYLHRNIILKEVVLQIKKEELIYLPTHPIDYNLDIWVQYSLTERGKLKKTTFDFTKIKHRIYYKEVKAYIKSCMNSLHLTHIIAGLNTLDEYVLLQNFNQSVIVLIKNELTKKYKVTTIRKILSSLDVLYTFLFGKANNPFKTIKFNNLDSMREETKVIPSYIDTLILQSKDVLGDEYYMLYKFLRFTGLRLKEALNLKQSDILAKIDGYYKVQYIPYKVSKYMSQTHAYVMIRADLADELKCLGNDYVFSINSRTFTNRVNALLSANNINWKFSSRQLRKTLATDLINKGATIQQVANQLNHLKYATTERYYIEINKQKLAKLNSEFFLDNLEVKECLEKKYNNCAFCSKLCTNSNFKEGWFSLYNNQKEVVQAFKELYGDNCEGIPQFIEELRLLTQYKLVLQKMGELI